jgi:hypothetical protein
VWPKQEAGPVASRRWIDRRRLFDPTADLDDGVLE